MNELEDGSASWREALVANLALVNDRLADYSSSLCSWHNSGEKLGHTFARFALPMVWDYTEVNPLSDSSGNYLGALDWVSRCVAHTLHPLTWQNRQPLEPQVRLECRGITTSSSPTLPTTMRFRIPT